MALNITVAGNLCKADTPTANLYYRAFFDQVAGGSSPSQWNDADLSLDGYFSFNLGDGDFLTQNGNAASGDRVIVAAWEGNADQDSDALTFAGFIVITLDGSPNYTRSFNLVDTSTAIQALRSSWPSIVEQLTNFNFNNTSEVSETGAAPTGQPGLVASTLEQYESGSGIEIFHGARIEHTVVNYDLIGGPDLVDYYWATYGDTPYPITRQFAAVGSYTTRLQATSGFGAQDTDEFLITVTLRAPTPGFLLSSNPADYNQNINATPGGQSSDPDGTVIGVDWSWDNRATWPEQGLALGTPVAATLNTSVDTVVVQRIHYNVGQGQPDAYVDEQQALTMLPVSAFTESASQGVSGETVTWSATPLGTITNYSWKLYEGVDPAWVEIASQDGPTATDFEHTFDTAGIYRLTLEVQDSDGESDTYIEDVTVDLSGGYLGVVSAGSRILSHVAKGVVA